MAEDIEDVCFGVKTGKAQSEHMIPVFPPTADMSGLAMKGARP